MKKSVRNILVILALSIALISICMYSYATNPGIMPRVNVDENMLNPENSENEEDGIMPISENGDVSDEKDIIHENVYRATTDSKLELKEDVYGNVFLAGNEIVISSNMIRGDLFVTRK